MQHERIIILDFGGQYNQLIARRVREQNIYCELLPYNTPVQTIKELKPKGIILTGGPSSVYEDGAPKLSGDIFSLNVPVLGICYGSQLIADFFGGKVTSGTKEFGKSDINYFESRLFDGLSKKNVCWMSHGDYVSALPEGCKITAATTDCQAAAFENEQKKIYGVQFHPEVMHTNDGALILKNFLYGICKVTGDWTAEFFVKETVSKLKNKIGEKTVLCALSGGVDSAVAAALIHKAVGDKLICIFVDHGLLRKDEAKEVISVFKDRLKMNVIKVDAADRFLSKLAGVTEPEQKRKIIGAEFIRVFEEEAKKIGKVDFLVQGTIYPDVIESGTGNSAVIKSHHNVGGLPSVIDFDEIIEPLRSLFKDEVRKVGFELGLDKSIVMRQPFPGPGLAIRIIGEITREKIATLQEADKIYRDEIAKAGLDKEIWQYFAVLTSARTVGVMGDARTYAYTLALRAVNSVDGMTADWVRIPYDVLQSASTKIVNAVKNINRVVYDITSKPPATIEWE